MGRRSEERKTVRFSHTSCVARIAPRLQSPVSSVGQSTQSAGGFSHVETAVRAL